MKWVGYFLVFLSVAYSSVAQPGNVVHRSSHVLAVNGSWDQTKNPQRAQFVTGNANIQTFFLNNYRLTIPRMQRSHRGFVELKFLIKPDGKLDSIEFIKRDDQMNDLEALNLLMLTDGAWRAGTVDGDRIAEWMLIRFFFFDGSKEKNIDKLKEKAMEAFERSKSQECIELCDKALDLNPFEVDLLILKVQSLLRLGRSKEACDIFKLARHYYSREADVWIDRSCEG